MSPLSLRVPRHRPIGGRKTVYLMPAIAERGLDLGLAHSVNLTIRLDTVNNPEAVTLGMA